MRRLRIFWTPAERTRFWERLIFALLVVMLSVNRCAKAPANLSPAGTQAFYSLRVQRVLDIIRDTAQDANAQTPPVISTETARKITVWHRSAIVVLHDAQAGYKAALLSGLDQLQNDLPAADKTKFSVYISLAKTILQEVG